MDKQVFKRHAKILPNAVFQSIWTPRSDRHDTCQSRPTRPRPRGGGWQFRITSGFQLPNPGFRNLRRMTFLVTYQSHLQGAHRSQAICSTACEHAAIIAIALLGNIQLLQRPGLDTLQQTKQSILTLTMTGMTGFWKARKQVLCKRVLWVSVRKRDAHLSTT